MSEGIEYDPLAGTHIDDAAAELVAIANRHQRPAWMRFNDITLTAQPGDNPSQIAAAYHTESERRRVAYQESPAGQKARAEAEARRREAEEAARQPLATFTISKPEVWDEWVRNNDDGYGSGIIRYAARWAHAMEAEIKAGKALPDVAKQLSHDADLEGITGFMYGAAVQVLASCWEHGEELRRWHNLSTQIRHEGERANQEGGVLNPAVLRLG